MNLDLECKQCGRFIGEMYFNPNDPFCVDCRTFRDTEQLELDAELDEDTMKEIMDFDQKQDDQLEDDEDKQTAKEYSNLFRRKSK